MLRPYYKDKGIIIYNGDCLEIMKEIGDGSIDMVLADPPYGTTACKWDSVIPLGPMWEQLKRIIKPNGAIVMMGAQPFTTKLINSNIKMFKYCWVWEKTRPTCFPNANRQPLRNVEDVVVFYNKQSIYNPQGIINTYKKCRRNKPVRDTVNSGDDDGSLCKDYIKRFTNYPRQILRMKSVGKCSHPTQKPVALMGYLINTYTNEGETVLDFTMGSGTTAVACMNLNRKFIGIELEPKYCEIACQRLSQVPLLIYAE